MSECEHKRVQSALTLHSLDEDYSWQECLCYDCEARIHPGFECGEECGIPKNGQRPKI